ncbi:hypothetical protein [Planctomicrobium sp. SH527]|uniref:hypothetical protein n=1 Tax=Planctomicrobium sp. SH527 TaxID=3448123 RepID=UPI003F5B8807
MTMTTRALFLSVLLGTVITLPLYGDSKPGAAPKPEEKKADSSEANLWMQIKLHSSQEILSGLTNADFKVIEEQSRRLMAFNFLEIWVQENSFPKTSEYQGQLNSFEFATKELVRTAKAKDIDGALNSYLLLTRSCVECHKLIRDVPKTP